ncbi:MAG: hypothetical protein NXI18_02560 [Alphaproteobacteria bacterium]|nr:hypothetical protein [Alphaproteobacteria bacterium]
MNGASLPIAIYAKRAKARLRDGEFAAAAEDLRRLLVAMPAEAGLFKLLAPVESHLQRAIPAAANFRRLFILTPGDLDMIDSALGLPPEADIPARQIRRLLVARPEVARGYGLLGAGIGRRDVKNTVRAAVLAPHNARYLAVAAAQLQAMGDMSRAEKTARRALAIGPDTSDALLVLAEHERALDRSDRALLLARRALSTAPTEPKAWITAAICAHRHSRFADARSMAATAATLRPRDAGYAARAATLLPHIVTDREEMLEIRDRIEALTESDGYAPIVDPVQEVGTVPFSLAYHGINDRALLEKLCAFYRRTCPSLTVAAPHIGRQRRPGRRRVAFVSEFFRDHSVYNMTEGHLRLIARDEIEVTVVQIGTLPAAARRRLTAVADRVIAVAPVLHTVRDTLAELELDVLVFADIGMTAMSYFLAFARLAPLQVVLPGHPVTTGIDTVDIFFTSAWMEPEDRADHYSETPYAVDGLAIAYADERIRHTQVARAGVGLPEEGALYLCGQMPFKIHPDFDRTLGDILERDPEGHVALFEAPQGYRNMSAALLERLRRSNADRTHLFDRLHILPRLPLERYIGVMKQADVVLDTFHFNGGNTTMQSLALGQPVVTHPSAMMRGRVTLAPLTRMGMRAELETASSEAFVTRAVDIGRTPDLAADLRRRLAAAAPELIDNVAAPRALERLILGEVPEAAIPEASGP